MKKCRGFSLLELLLYISLVSVVTLVISTTFLSFNRGRGQVESKGEVNSAMNFALEKVSQDLRSGSAVTTPFLAGETADDSLVVTVGSDTITYCLNDGQLRREVGAGSCGASSASLTSPAVYISSIDFTRVENTNATLGTTMVSIIIKIDAVYDSVSPDWQYSASKETAVTLSS